MATSAASSLPWSVLTTLRVIFAVHAAIDAASLLAILFPSALLALRCFSEVNVAFFVDDAHASHPLLRRVFAYWTGSMSLARVAAAAAPTFETFSVVAMMYVMEMLAFEYEGFTAQTVVARKARTVSMIAGMLAVATMLASNWLLLLLQT